MARVQLTVVHLVQVPVEHGVLECHVAAAAVVAAVAGHGPGDLYARERGSVYNGSNIDLHKNRTKPESILLLTSVPEPIPLSNSPSVNHSPIYCNSPYFTCSPI